MHSDKYGEHKVKANQVKTNLKWNQPIFIYQARFS